MGLKSIFWASLVLMSGYSCASVTSKYNPQMLCPGNVSVAVCDSLVEQAITKDLPRVIQRKGSVLRLHAENGKIVERRSSQNASQLRVSWVCDYFPAFGFIRVCHRLMESSLTEYVNIRSGDSVQIRGWPTYSPSGKRILIVDGYDDAISSLEIWRFEEGQLVREFVVASPPGQGWDAASWNNERVISPGSGAEHVGIQYLLKNYGGWQITPR